MTRYLLDTHAALFWWAGGERLGDAAREVIGTDDVELFVSAASAWEIATKHRIGKLDGIGDPSRIYPALMTQNRFRALDITSAHALHAGALPGRQGDPFDRLIAAQGLMENLVVITRDGEIAAFGCKVLW
ncbi:type II toxin-antitoxin system VapC family toxin [Sphingomonas sp.]|uniref:type II toxin-antitoxin system VapC family toxin n=1 Tax=Sphingomonas sp. TaxID=28214 RepID=UPI0035BBAED6